MATMSRAAASTILIGLGFRTNTAARYKQALRDFQGGWNLGAALDIDGLLGPKTSAALALSEKNRRASKGTASAHFSFSEFTCHCGGRYSACRRYAGEGSHPGSGRHLGRAVLQAAERLRTKQAPLTIVSGYRCDGHNKAVGGATSSQHRWGAAADMPPKLSVAAVRGLGVYSGIGYDRSTGHVRHADLRHLSGVNPTAGSVSRPTVWLYN